MDELLHEPLSKRNRYRIDFINENEAREIAAHVLAAHGRVVPDELVRSGIRLLSKHGGGVAPFDLKQLCRFLLSSSSESVKTSFELRYLKYLLVSISGGAVYLEGLSDVLYQFVLDSDGLTIRHIMKRLRLAQEPARAHLHRLEEAGLLRSEKKGDERTRFFLNNRELEPIVTQNYIETSERISGSLLRRLIGWISTHENKQHGFVKIANRRLNRAISDQDCNLSCECFLSILLFCNSRRLQHKDARNIIAKARYRLMIKGVIWILIFIVTLIFIKRLQS